MRKRGQYTAFEWQIIAGSVMIVLVAMLFLSESGITGMATKSQPTEITLIEQNTTPILIEKPILEKPTEVEGTIQEPPLIETQGCVVPYSGIIINESTTFCGGTYYLNQTYISKIGSSATILIDNSFIELDCNNTVIIGNNLGTGLQTSTVPSVNNVKIKNCMFMNYSVPIYILGQSIKNSHNITLENIIVREGRGTANILVLGCDDCIFRNIDSSKAINNTANPLPPHGIYISGGTGLRTGNNILVENSRFENNSAAGIRISDQEGRHHINLTVLNTIIANNEDSGLAINACQNCRFIDNSISGNKNRGISIGTTAITESDNVLIENNTFYNNNLNDYILWGSKNILIKNNIYNSGSTNLNIRTESVSNYSIEESIDEITVTYQSNNPYSPNARLTHKYPGLKKFTFTNNNIAFNLSSPYNDVKNISNSIILSNNTQHFSISLMSGQQIEVGDFVADPVEENTAPVMDSVMLNNNLTCITAASDANDDSLTTTIEWYYNSTLNKTTTASSDTQSNMTGTHYCRARAYDGTEYSDWMTSNTVIINATVNVTVNQTNDTYIALSSITLSNDLNCSGTINKLSNITMDYYLDGSLNSTIELETSGAFVGYAQRSNGTWYCNVTASDGINTTSRISNTVIINENASNVSVNAPPAITVGLSNGLVCSGTVNELVNMTILFFKDSAVEDNIVLQNINGSFSASADESPGTWYCQVSATDGLNTTIAQSNTVTINEPESSSSGGGGGGGGSGGGGSYSPVEVKEEPKEEPTIIQENTTQETPQKAVEEPEKENITPIIEETAPIVIEQPKKVSIWEKYWKIYILCTIIFSAITLLVIRTKVEVKQDDKLNDYIIKSLQAGYPYSAIRRALSRRYKQTIIDHHFHILRRANHKPVKIRKIEHNVPKERQKQAIMSIKAYIIQQKNMGYKEKDVIKVLLQNGYPKALIKEAGKNA